MVFFFFLEKSFCYYVHVLISSNFVVGGSSNPQQICFSLTFQHLIWLLFCPGPVLDNLHSLLSPTPLHPHQYYPLKISQFHMGLIAHTNWLSVNLINASTLIYIYIIYTCLEYYSLLFNAKVVPLPCTVPCHHALSIAISLSFSVSMLMQHRFGPPSPLFSATESMLSIHVFICDGVSLKGTSDAATGAVLISPVTPKMPIPAICQVVLLFCIVSEGITLSQNRRLWVWVSLYSPYIFSVNSSVFLFVPL